MAASGKWQGCLWHLWEGVYDVFFFGKSIFGVSLLGMNVFCVPNPSNLQNQAGMHIF
jgi:hypothetical protein